MGVEPAALHIAVKTHRGGDRGDGRQGCGGRGACAKWRRRWGLHRRLQASPPLTTRNEVINHSPQKVVGQAAT